MDYRLSERLAAWEDQIKKLKNIEQKFLLLSASQKAFEAKAFLDTEGKNVTERQAKANLNPELISFRKGLALAENDCNNEKRLLALRQHEYLGEHKTYGIENDGIKRGMGER